MGKGGRTRILTAFERGVRWQCVCSQRCVVTATPCVRTSRRPGEGLCPGNTTSHRATQARGTAPRCVCGSVPRGPSRWWDHTSVPSPCSFRSALCPQCPSLLKQVTGFPCFSRLRHSRPCGRSAVGLRLPDSGPVASCRLSALHTVLPWTQPCAEGGHPCGSRAPTLVTRAAVEQLVAGRSAGVALQAHRAPRASLGGPRGSPAAGEGRERCCPRSGGPAPLRAPEASVDLSCWERAPRGQPPITSHLSPAVRAERSPAAAGSPQRQGAAAQRTQLCGLVSAVPFVGTGVGMGVWDA